LLIIFSKDASYFIASRFFSGFGGGGAFVMIPMFVAEISEDRVRGRLGSMLVLSCNIGILFAYVAGYFVNYVESACIMLPIPMVFFIGFLFFPDTPTYLVKAKKFTVMFSYIKNSRYFWKIDFFFQEAEMSLRYYRGLPEYPEELTEEFKVELVKLQSSSNDGKKAESDDSKITWKDLSKYFIFSAGISFEKSI
jgi:MFS family permease